MRLRQSTALPASATQDTQGYMTLLKLPMIISAQVLSPFPPGNPLAPGRAAPLYPQPSFPVTPQMLLLAALMLLVLLQAMPLLLLHLGQPALLLLIHPPLLLVHPQLFFLATVVRVFPRLDFLATVVSAWIASQVHPLLFLLVVVTTLSTSPINTWTINTCNSSSSSVHKPSRN